MSPIKPNQTTRACPKCDGNPNACGCGASKPRGFDLQFSDLCYDDWDCKVTVDKGTDANVEPHELIRVIEHAAYTALLAEAEALRADIDVAIRGMVARGFGNAALNEAAQRFDAWKEKNK